MTHKSLPLSVVFTSLLHFHLALLSFVPLKSYKDIFRCFLFYFFDRKKKQNKSSRNDHNLKNLYISVFLYNATFYFDSKQSMVSLPIDRPPCPSPDTYFTVSWRYCVSENRKCNILTLRIESIEISLWLIQIILLVKGRRTLCCCSRRWEVSWTRMFSFELAAYAHRVCYAIITLKDKQQLQCVRCIFRMG